MKDRWLFAGLGFAAGLLLMFTPVILARGEATRARAALDHAQRMSADLAPLRDPGGSFPLPAAVRLPEGGAVVVDAAGVERIRRNASAGDVLILPAGSLAPGRYVLRSDAGESAFEIR